MFEPLPGVPSSRAECRDGERPCRYVRCKWHLWLVLGYDRSGRRWHGKSPPSTVRAAWLEEALPASCTLDVAESVGQLGRLLTDEQIGQLMGIRQSAVRAIAAAAMKKLAANAEPLLEFDAT